jgi:hypothetical protein
MSSGVEDKQLESGGQEEIGPPVKLVRAVSFPHVKLRPLSAEPAQSVMPVERAR